MSKYITDKKILLKRIKNFNILKYIKFYPNWKSKLASTDTYFVSLNKGKYSFAPVKYIVSKNQNDHAATDGGVARKKAIKLGFVLVEGNAKKYYRIWCKENNIKYKKNVRLLANIGMSDVLSSVHEMYNLECRLKELFVINGNKSLQGELGEWLSQIILGAEPLMVNAKGADLFLQDGSRVEVKTKRPHDFNNAAIEVGASKVYGDLCSRYIVFIWLREDYRIKHISLLSTSEIIKKYGQKKMYEIKAHVDFPEYTISSAQDVGKVKWRRMIKDKSFLKEWLDG